MIEHPDIRRVIRTGYPDREPKFYGFDFFGNEVSEGEEIMTLDDDFFLKEELSRDAIAILHSYGSEKRDCKIKCPCWNRSKESKL